MQNEIKNILEKAGWYEGRMIDIEYIIDELSQEGYEITNKEVLNLFKEFWNLKIEFQTIDKRASDIRLNTEAIFDMNSKIVLTMSNAIGEPLIPVGYLHHDAAILLVSNSGMFFMGWEDKFFKIGDNFFDMLINVINQKDVDRIY